jgi:hypothetical protein
MTMLKTLDTVKRLLHDNYQNESEDFIRGYKLCYDLFEIGIKKNPQYNLALRIHTAEKEIEKTKKELEAERIILEKLKKQYSNVIEIIKKTDVDFATSKAIAKRKIRIKLYLTLFGDKTDREKIEFFKIIMKDWDY